MSAPSESGRVSTGVATVEVHREPCAGRVRDLGRGRDIAHRPGGIGWRLQPHELGAPRPHRRAQRLAAAVVHLLDLEPPAGREAQQPGAQGPIHDFRHDDVVARIDAWNTAVAAAMPEPNRSVAAPPSSAVSVSAAAS